MYRKYRLSRSERALVTLLALFLTAWTGSIGAQSFAAGEFMFLAARPTPKGPGTFAATLFGIDPSTHRLTVLKELVPVSDGVDFIRSSEGVLSLGSPHIIPDHLTIVRRRAQSIATLNVALPPKSFPYNNVLVSEAGGVSVELLTLLSASSGTRTTDVAVALDPTQGLPRVLHDPAIKQFSYFDIEGETGGASTNWDGFITELDQSGISGKQWPGMPKVLAPAPSELLKRTKPLLISVVCGNKRFLVVTVAQDHTILEWAKESILFVFDLDAKTWTRLALEGSLTRVRLFDSWLTAVTVVAPGAVSQTAGQTKAAAQNRGLDEFNPDAVFPGELTLIDLKTGERGTIATGQADSEILLVDGNNVLYRVNDQLLTGKVSGGAVGGRTVIATDERVHDIHWTL